MELLIFSDSHGRVDGMRAALERQTRPPQAVCFLGDGLRDTERLTLGRAMLYDVRGNCDLGMEADAPIDRTVTLAGHKLFLTHGHMHGVKSGLGALIAAAARMEADVVLFGHTHAPTLIELPAGETVGGTTLARPMYLFNPGSIGMGGSFGTLYLTETTVLFSHGQV